MRFEGLDRGSAKFGLSRPHGVSAGGTRGESSKNTKSHAWMLLLGKTSRS